MTAKEQKIKEAWELVGLGHLAQLTQKDGWFKCKPGQYSGRESSLDRLKMNSLTSHIRPKSLAGIENNNGWIRIESEADLPTEEVDCYVFYGEKLMTIAVWDNRLKSFFSGVRKLKNITHYQQIVMPKKPVY